MQTPQAKDSLSPALASLRAPGPWWSSLRQRHACNDIVFEPFEHEKGLRIPLALFDSVAENLLQNALVKRQQEAGMAIRVSLSADASILRVCDNGSAVPESVVKNLLRAPVPSENGLGIGLFNVARQAERYGYCLRLISNQPGNVCFELARNASGQGSQ